MNIPTLENTSKHFGVVTLRFHNKVNGNHRTGYWNHHLKDWLYFEDVLFLDISSQGLIKVCCEYKHIVIPFISNHDSLFTENRAIRDFVRDTATSKTHWISGVSLLHTVASVSPNIHLVPQWLLVFLPFFFFLDFDGFVWNCCCYCCFNGCTTHGSSWARDWIGAAAATCVTAGNTESFNPLLQTVDRTHASTVIWDSGVEFLTHCAIVGTPSPRPFF